MRLRLKLLFAQKPQTQHGFLQCQPLFVSKTGRPGGVFIAHRAGKAGDQHQRLPEVAVHGVPVGGDAREAAPGKGREGVCQQPG